MVLGLWNNSTIWILRLRIKSSVMDTWHLVSRVTYLNSTGFLENFLASSSLQQFQVQSNRNGREVKWLNLWQATAECLEKPCVFTSCLNRANDWAKFDSWAGTKTLLYFRLFSLMTWIWRLSRFLETATLKVLSKEVVQSDQLRHWQNTDYNRRLLIDFF